MCYVQWPQSIELEDEDGPQRIGPGVSSAERDPRSWLTPHRRARRKNSLSRPSQSQEAAKCAAHASYGGDRAARRRSPDHLRAALWRVTIASLCMGASGRATAGSLALGLGVGTSY